MSGDATGGQGSFGGGSFRLVENLAEELNLLPGQILRAWVADPLPDYPQKIFITLKGNRAVARTTLDVDRGDELMVRVESTGPPIELKLFRPEDAREQVAEEQLQTCLETMDFSASDQMMEIARFLMESHIPLTPETVSGASQCWEQLGNDSERSESSVRAFRFLSERDLPLHPGLVDTLSHLASDRPSPTPWQQLSDEIDSAPSEIWDSDWRELVRSLGIDMVNQIGKWPHTASKTRHAQLLRTIERGEGSSADREQWAQLLAIALASISGPEKWVLLPFFQGKSARLLTMSVDSTENQEDWHVEARAEFKSFGEVGVSLEISVECWDLVVSIADQQTARRVESHQQQLKEILEGPEREVKINVRHEEPQALEPFSTGGGPPDTDQAASGKVDFTI